MSWGPPLPQIVVHIICSPNCVLMLMSHQLHYKQILMLVSTKKILWLQYYHWVRIILYEYIQVFLCIFKLLKLKNGSRNPTSSDLAWCLVTTILRLIIKFHTPAIPQPHTWQQSQLIHHNFSSVKPILKTN